MIYTKFIIALSLPALTSFSYVPTAIAGVKIESCSLDRSALLSLDENSFDQDFAGGWRAVATQDGCKIVAADLIREYIEKNKTTSTILIFHEAQMRAMAGQTEDAIRLFAKTFKEPGEPDKIGWNYYVEATIAFLKKDAAALQSARAKLAEVLEPDGYNPVDVNGQPMNLIWPPNLNVVDGFIKCFGKTYNESFSECNGPLLKEDPRFERKEEYAN
ncbi:MAG TPA: hypothetical protein PKH39_10685 [Woeseiaceae bacterium]|nr:hypothetical protein [Woeseiaceae bacterium]